MLLTEITYTEQYGYSFVTTGYLLVDIATHIINNGNTSPLWADNFKGKSRLCLDKPQDLFAKIQVQDSVEITPELIEYINLTNERLIIVAWPSGKSRLYYPKSYEAMLPYTGRQYYKNKTDCYGLAVDFYKKEFNINLNAYFEKVSWLHANTPKDSANNILMLHYASEGFEQIAAPEHGDGILLDSINSSTPRPDHVAIYLGDNTILHHYADKLSCIQPFSSFWKEKVVMYLRHKDKP